MKPPRTILHLDLDAFFCAVEEQRDPALRGAAFAVGGRPDQRGVVASCSYPARQFGVRSAMPMAQALRLCPDLIIVPNRHSDYRAVSRQVMALLHATTPLVQPISIDEAFLDMTGHHVSPFELACQLQARINTELGLPCSLGVASNKLVAKIANTVGKASAGGDQPPNSIQVVPPGTEAAFLAPLPARALWGVGPRTEEALAALGIHTIGDLACADPSALARRFGKLGRELHQRANGIDPRPVETEGDTKSVSRETTFARDVRDAATLHRTLRRLSDKVGRGLRAEGLRGHTVKIKLRWPDFETLTRQTQVDPPTDVDDVIYSAALDLLAANWRPGRPVRLIGVGVSGFDRAAYQPGLFDEPRDDPHDLLDTLDALRDRFGESVIRRASTLPPPGEDKP